MTDLPNNPQSAEFKEAAAKVMSFSTLPSVEISLKFYGLYKFGCHGENPQPAPWVSQGTAGKKWGAWNEVAKSGITYQEAQQQYVQYYHQVKSEYE